MFRRLRLCSYKSTGLLSRGFALLLALLAACAAPCLAQAPDAPLDVLTDAQWERVDECVERGLKWLASEQQPDGSFPTLPQGQPGITSLCVLAFMAHGHLPGDGPYGEHLGRAIKRIGSQQKQNGLIALIAPGGAVLHRNVRGDVGSVVAYNHAISALVLSEAFAVSGEQDASSLDQVIQRALTASLEMQRWPKRPEDHGGWRYINVHDQYDSDLSVTGWELMFLRSAKNAGFDVPEQPIEDAVAYVRRCFDQSYGTFEYEVSPRDRRSRGMAGAGVLALAHAGFHNSPEAKMAGDWILKHDFDQYNEFIFFSDENKHKDRYHYGVFNCSQAMYQLGGDYWRQFFPAAAMAIVNGQQADGSWPAEKNNLDGMYGNAYSSALALLALGAPNQLLPIFQR